MFIPMPPPEAQQRLVAVHVQPCPPGDPVCRIEWANDVLEGILTMKPFDLGLNDSGDVVVTPGVGQLTWTGLAPRVVIRPA
jgi:hypothetical protein